MQVVAKFESIIDNATSLDTGFIVLEHDLYQQSTSLAIDYVLPYALAKKDLVLEPIYQCLGQNLEDVYIETSPNDTDSRVETTVDRGSTATAGLPAGANANGSSTGAAGRSATIDNRLAALVMGLVGAAAVAITL